MLAYLDHASDSPLLPAAAEAMLPWWRGRFGNPSGGHAIARAARQAIEDGRDQVAALVGVEPGGVVFTSGGTESDNLAVFGVASAHAGPIVISAVEHPAVVEAARFSGREVRVAPVDSDGVVDLQGLRAVLDASVSLVSIQLVNHETGVVQPLGDLARRIRKWSPGAVIHTDAVQAALWLDVAAAASSADLISLSGHKIGGPQGTGALAMRGRTSVTPILRGGGQERELRSGTQNVAGIVGFAAAAEVVLATRHRWTAEVAARRDELQRRILAGVDNVIVSGSEVSRAAGHLHVRLEAIESESLVLLLDEMGVCASAGAACASGAVEPSPVLLAMGASKSEALSGLRLTLGPSTSDAEVDAASIAVTDAVKRLREAAA